MEGNTLQSLPRANADSKYLDVSQGTVRDQGMGSWRADLRWKQTSRASAELGYFSPALGRTFIFPFNSLLPDLQTAVLDSIL